jgi:hypothetical protein
MLWTLPKPGTNQMTGISNDKKFFCGKKAMLVAFFLFYQLLRDLDLYQVLN